MTEPPSVPLAHPGPASLATSTPEELQTCLRDLLSLVALPPLFRERGPGAVLTVMIEALEACLPVDFACIQVDPGAAPERVVRIQRGSVSPDAAEWQATIAACTSCDAPTIDTPVGTLRLAHAPLGYRGTRGRLVVASREGGFPTSTQLVLLHAAASLADAGLGTARVLAEREEALQAKDDFLAMLGHELRNPLAPIETALLLMQQRGDGTLERERLVIQRQVSHLGRLVDDLLDVSRVTRGRIDLKKAPIEIAQVVTHAIEMVAPLLDERRHALEVHVPQHGLTVDADPIRLAQVIANLLTNAAKYTEPGGQIMVRASGLAGEVVLEVRDSGMGISADLLPRVFDLFVQDRRSLERTNGGLGLGLAIARSLVTLHGGTIAARSDGRGRGSVFEVRLPVMSPDLAVVPGYGASPVRRELPRRAHAGLRVLIVDDNVDGAEMLATALSMNGCQTRVAHDGLGALRVFAEFKPTIALLDIGLPVMDGYELAGRLRALDAGGGLRLIAITGYGQDSDRQRARAAGFEAHLIKPVDFDALDRVLAGQATAAATKPA